MTNTFSARVPPRVEKKLVEYCAKQGITRTEALVRALDEFLDRRAGGGDAYTLAADLIPERGSPGLQSDSVRKLARAAFRGSRAR